MKICCWCAERCRVRPAATFLFARRRARGELRKRRETTMPVVDVKNLDGKTIGQVQLADDVFGAKVNEHLLHEAVRHYLAGERAGTHKTKDKSEVSGSGKKLWKQKGTGRAR